MHARCCRDIYARSPTKRFAPWQNRRSDGHQFIRFMVRDREPVNIENVLDHFDYVRKLVGVEYVAVGSDLDLVGDVNPVGGGFQPTSQPNFSRYGYHMGAGGKIAVNGLDHSKRTFDLVEGLIRRGLWRHGYSPDHWRKCHTRAERHLVFCEISFKEYRAANPACTGPLMTADCISR
jgi:Membrane dipeptidase (Peptidase family M19)